MHQIKYINAKWEPDNSDEYVLIEERVTTKPWHRNLLQYGLVEAHLDECQGIQMG